MTANTLISIIKENILPGSTIYSDCWNAYHFLNSEGFHHLMVNNLVNIIDPETGTHTNTIESIWRALKNHSQSMAQPKVNDTYYAQYCLRKQFLKDKEDPFLEILQLIKKVYHLSFEPPFEEIESYRKRKVDKNPPVVQTKIARKPLCIISMNA